jgi:hypothetical protein
MGQALQQNPQSLRNSQSRFGAYGWHAILPESPDGTADADGFAPPKKLLNKAAILCRDVNG